MRVIAPSWAPSWAQSWAPSWAQIGTLIAALSVRAAAAPPKALSRADLDKIANARQAALPPVDQTKVGRCQTFLDAYNKDPAHGDAAVVQAARCYQDAGAIGIAITTWQLVTRYQPAAPAAKDATRELGTLYERAALLDRAADWDETYFGHYSSEPDAKDKLARAACIRFQLGDAKATADVKKLHADANTLCDAIHPIEMPKP